MNATVVGVCLSIAVLCDTSLANAQHEDARAAAATAAMRVVRDGYPAGRSAIVYRGDSALAVQVARNARVVAVPLPDVVNCAKMPSAKSCLVNEIVVALEIFSAHVAGESAIVIVAARAKSDGPTGLRYSSWIVRLRCVGGVWVVEEKRPGAIS